jgi:hypothetical protein
MNYVAGPGQESSNPCSAGISCFFSNESSGTVQSGQLRYFPELYIHGYKQLTESSEWVNMQWISEYL